MAATPTPTGAGPIPGDPVAVAAPPPHRRMGTLVDVTRWRAETTPERIAFTFLLDGEDDAQDLTYAELDRRASAIAAGLLQSADRGARALVVLEPGLDYIAALLGCFYAGITPAPVYPPDPFRIARTLPRLRAIFGSAKCELLISSGEILGGPGGALRQTCPGGALEIERLLTTPHGSELPGPSPDELALLQYTSGTTGEPRGVPLTHGQVAENLRGMETLLDVDGAVGVQWLPPYHDLGLIGGVLLPLFAGRRMVLMSPLSFMQRPARWLRALSNYQATSSAAPNFAFELCLKKITDSDCQGLDLSHWSIAVSGAEPVRADTLERFAERFAPHGFRREALMPAYGMAETTLMVSIARQDSPPTVVEIDPAELAHRRVVSKPGGKAVVGCGPQGPGVELMVVDPESRQRTDGVGEVWVRGPSVAAGYWQQPESTAERFNQTTACGEDGFFRTGDLGFVRDGELFLVGRSKELIILAGRNFYPHDLELAVQQADPALKLDGGAAFAAEDPNRPGDGEQVVYFQEVQRPKKQDLDALLLTVRRVLTEETGLEPLRVVLLPVGELPKTSSGKTRRAECWRQYLAGELTVKAEWPAGAAAAEPDKPEPPQTETERWLAGCWQSVLSVEEVFRGDNFFRLGGRSLQVTEMLTRVRKERGVTLPIESLIDRPELAELAAEVDRLAVSAPTAQDHAPAAPPATGPQPLSQSQRRFWLVEQLGPPGGANVPVALKLAGSVDRAKLEAALNEVIRRHPILRAGFEGDAADARQLIADADELPPVEIKALPVTTQREPSECLDAVLAADWVWRRFDLAKPPLMRARLWQSEDHAVLVLVLHHLVCDGASAGVLMDELAALCDEQPLPKAATNQSTSHDEADGVDYWRERLQGKPRLLDLPLEPGAADADVATWSLPLDQKLVAGCDRLAADLAVTPFAVWLAAWQQVISRYSGQPTVGVGIAVAGDVASSHLGAAGVGCHINTLPVFLDAAPPGDGESFAQLVTRLSRQLLADLSHASTPWEAIVEAAGHPRVPRRMPVVQAFFVHDDRTAAGRKLAGATIEDAATDYRGLGLFDVSLVAETARPDPRLKLASRSELLAPAVIDGMLASVVDVLRAAIDSPSVGTAQLPVPPATQQQRLRRGEMPTSDLPAPMAVLDRFGEHVESRPDSIAVECGDRRLAYRELDELIDRLAGGLAERGVLAGDRVGLLMSRTVELPAAILAVWRVGAAYVPLDPDYPASRLAVMGDDADLACVVSHSELVDKAPGDAADRLVTVEELLASESTMAAEAHGDAGRIAYVMYTSGSTGKPKGVMVPHAAVANLIDSFARRLPMAPEHAMLASTTFAFDISVLELLLPLATGAKLVLADSQTAGDASRLAKLLGARPVSHLQGAPSTFRSLLAVGWRPAAGQTVLCGGEELTPDLANTLVESAGRLINVYGPTETTIWSTEHEIAAGEPIASVPIGSPIARTRCYVLDEHQRPTPVGVWGELAIAGAGVADGYWRRPEQTAERFVDDPFDADPNAKMYLTGDAARWMPEDDRWVLQFGGRTDGQVKVRGHRIELREIEIALLAHPAVREAAVVATGEAERASLAAYFVTEEDSAPTPGELREHVLARLPSYMAPSHWARLDSLPRTPNGKLDRKSLPSVGQAAAGAADYVAPRTPLEETLAEWAQQLLQVQRIGVHDNFFERGGQSLLATQIVVRMRDRLGVEPPLRDVYERPTIAAWAELVVRTELQSTQGDSDELLEKLESMSDEEAAAYLESLADE
ncbi:MAG: amino acid adenylation domain-containing protein [Planctomycetota bacterium]